MAEEAFDRVYSLAIGKNQLLINKTIPLPLVKPSNTPTPLEVLVDNTSSARPPGDDSVDILVGTTSNGARSYTDFNAKPANALVITELRITADIQYTKEGATNKQGCVITIYNLNRDNQKFISSEDTILLRAGYRSIDGNNPPLIFSGQVKSVETVKQGQDTITKIICTAVDVGRKNIRFSKTPVRNETNLDVANYFSAVAASNGIPKGRVYVPDIVTYPSGYAANGLLWDAMEKFCQNYNLACYVVLGRLYIEPKAVIAPVSARVIVSAENIKDTIRPEDDSTGKSSVDESKRSGIAFNTFLNGNISPARLVNIDFGEYRGDYLVTSVAHKLDLEGKDWDTIVSCKRREG